MTTMLERVALALANTDRADAGLNALEDADQLILLVSLGRVEPLHHYTQRAKAALLAIREPSLDLSVIGAGPVNEHMRGTCKADVFAAQDAFTAMIDAILEEPSNG